MDNSQNTPVAAEEGSTEQPESKRLYPRWMIRHVGLNRKERHRLAKVARTGPAGLESKNDARYLLNTAPANYPVRNVNIDGRSTYLFEPQYQIGMQEFRKVSTEELTALTEKPTPQVLQGIYVKASRAFVTKIVELAKAKTTEIKESVEKLTASETETVNV